MSDRSHLSIGEVLSLLREEFPDVTISKIRFLESQGLVDPERTPSGYRKFYDHDVERLRWILRQQRENFLPLKIIRGRLTEQGDEIDEPTGEGYRLNDGESLTAAGPAAGAGGASSDREGSSVVEPASSTHPSASSRVSGPTSAAPAAPTAPSRAAAPEPRPAATAPAPGAGGSGGPSTGPGLWGAARLEPGSGTPRPGPPGAAASQPERAPARGPSGSQPPPAGPARRVLAAGAAAHLGDEAETYSAEELAGASGSTVAMVDELQQFGLIKARTLVAGIPYFDTAALDVVRAAAGFSRHGVEARHLRAWRNAADREASLFEQVVMPLLRQRNPEARRQAAATLSELTVLGADLRKALIDQAVRQIR
jgi:DNA-binding transcriptional MerR regulator